jgi:hypothetical protein
MRRAKLAEIGETPAPARSGNAGDIGAQLAQMLAGLDQITAIQRSHEEFVTALATINMRLDQIEKSVSHLKQYETDHNELHKLMAAAQGESTTAVQKTLAEAVTSHQQTMELSIAHHSQQVASTLATNIETTRSMIQAMVQAINEATNKDIDVHLPEQNLQVNIPERELLDYKIIRKGNLLDTIREVKQ